MLLNSDSGLEDAKNAPKGELPNFVVRQSRSSSPN